MILNYSEKKYVDVDAITVLAPDGAITRGGAVRFANMEEFQIVEKAFLWKHQHAIYNKELKKGEK